MLEPDLPPSTMRQGLSREAIVDAGLTTWREQGSLRMQDVARRLGVTAGALYRHVEHRADLLGAMVDRLAAEHPTPTEGPWRTYLEGMARAMVARYRDYPGLFAFSLANEVLTTRQRVDLERALTYLEEAGLERDRANALYYAQAIWLIRYVGGYDEHADRSILPGMPTEAETFETGLGWLLDGIERSITG